jgi:hypothetical protein
MLRRGGLEGWRSWGIEWLTLAAAGSGFEHQGIGVPKPTAANPRFEVQDRFLGARPKVHEPALRLRLGAPGEPDVFPNEPRLIHDGENPFSELLARCSRFPITSAFQAPRRHEVIRAAGSCHI